MTDFIASTLAARGEEPVIAHYLPYPVAPELSVPSFCLLRRRAGTRLTLAPSKYERHDMGAWLPEFEFTHYLANRHWRNLMDSCQAFVAVSGNVLSATPFWQTRRPFLAWVASDWEGDRVDRVRQFPPARRLFDRVFVGPVVRRLERKLLANGRILPLSKHSAATLAAVAGTSPAPGILGMPVDTQALSADASRVVPWRIGFLGRFTDPRKNIGLLLGSLSEMRRQGLPATALIVGAVPDAAVLDSVKRLGIEEAVEFRPAVPRTEIGAVLRTLDVFALPSHQEGLCIAALEAMACGVPVVSTRCGGPEEFVIEGTSGILCDSTPQGMAASLAALLGDRALRARLSAGATRLVAERYAPQRAAALFMREFDQLFAPQPARAPIS
jgi:glycosyltransferase involved in cell wall biosynthesis